MSYGHHLKTRKIAADPDLPTAFSDLPARSPFRAVMLYSPPAMQDSEPSSECCAGFQDRLHEWSACVEKTVREEPVKAAGYAFAAGLVVAVLPIGRIVGAVVRLALALVRPALLVFGFVKLFEEIDRRRE